MTVQEGVVYRARPVCDSCRWTGGWHTSTLAPADAHRAADLLLAEHIGFWHQDEQPATARAGAR